MNEQEFDFSAEKIKIAAIVIPTTGIKAIITCVAADRFSIKISPLLIFDTHNFKWLQKSMDLKTILPNACISME